MSTLTTAQEVKDTTLEYRYISQTIWDNFIDDVYNNIGASFHIKGDINCSTNPNYPAALEGDIYRVSVKGKIGGASGVKVEVGDLIICWVTNPGGTQAAVGAFWDINQVGLQDIFEISGDDLTFQVTSDLIQTIGRDYSLTVGRNKIQTITGTQTEDTVNDRSITVATNKYIHQVTAASGNTIETVTGTYTGTWTGASSETYSSTKTQNVVGDRSLTVATNKYIHQVTAASGNVTESIAGTETKDTAGDLTRTVATNKYSFQVTAASGNVVESVAGTETKNTVGNLTRTVATNKYSFAVVAASGNVTESIAGTETKNTVGDLTRTVATNKYSFQVTAASGVASEVFAGALTITGVSRAETFSSFIHETSAGRTFNCSGGPDFIITVGGGGSAYEVSAGGGTYAFVVPDGAGASTETSSKAITRTFSSIIENCAASRQMNLTGGGDLLINIAAGGAHSFIMNTNDYIKTIVTGTVTTTVKNNDIKTVGGASTETVTLKKTIQASVIATGTSLAAFASNAAAVAGGLLAGELYYTNVAGDGLVKVVL